MPAYVIVDTRITDPEAYEDYKARARPIVESFGGEYLARGGELEVMEGDLWTPTRLVILRFPDVAAARKWAASDEYAPVKAIRHGAAECTLALVDGI